MYPSNLRFASLDNIRKTFKIPSRFGLVSAIAEKGPMSLRGCLAVYREQMRVVLRFSVHYLSIDIMDYWEIKLGRLLLMG